MTLADQTAAAAHCERVAAWTYELAGALGLAERDRAALYAAGLLHHEARGTDEISSQQECEADQRRLASRLNRQEHLAVASLSETARDAHSILRALFDAENGQSRGHTGMLAQVLGAAHAFDEHIEEIPEHSGEIEEPAVAFVLPRLRVCSRTDVASAASTVPALPSATKLMRILADKYLSFQTLETFASSDPLLAARLLKTANSAFYSPRTTLTTLPQAIGYMGIEDSRRILLASALHPVLNGLRSAGLWTHALQAAQTAESLAEKTTGVDPGEAYLLGLLHDVGKLAYPPLPPQVHQKMDRLISAGCPPAVVEFVVCGMGHAEAGAMILRSWKLPEHLLTAVRWHHSPESVTNRLAAILWLTEHLLEPREELPAEQKLKSALAITGLGPGDLSAVRQNRKSALAAL
jgi:putative nucleotidyltransferase with HDIG domain